MKRCIQISIALLFIACGQQETARQIPLVLKEPAEYADFRLEPADSLLVLQLPKKTEMTANTWPLADPDQPGNLGASAKFLTEGNHWYALDSENPNYILRFDQTGRYLSKFGNDTTFTKDPSGLAIVDFTISKGRIHTLTNFPTTLSVFSQTGKLEYRIPIPEEAIAFGISNNDHILINNSSYGFQGRDRIIEYDNAGIKLRSFLKNDFKGKKLPVHERNFFSSDSSILLAEAFQNHIAAISEEGLKTEYLFDFGKHQVPATFWDLPIYDGFEELNKQGFYNVIDIQENDEYRLVVLKLQNTSGTTNHILRINRTSQKVRSLSLTQGSALEQLVAITDQNELIFYSHSNKLTAEKHFISKELQLKLEKMDKNTPVLVWFKFAK